MIDEGAFIGNELLPSNSAATLAWQKVRIRRSAPASGIPQYVVGFASMPSR
jgi:hypothetical protein